MHLGVPCSLVPLHLNVSHSLKPVHLERPHSLVHLHLGVLCSLLTLHLGVFHLMLLHLLCAPQTCALVSCCFAASYSCTWVLPAASCSWVQFCSAAHALMLLHIGCIQQSVHQGLRGCLVPLHMDLFLSLCVPCSLLPLHLSMPRML